MSASSNAILTYRLIDPNTGNKVKKLNPYYLEILMNG